ncbi:helix-turn-helix domain-containing protein [Niastella sp. OAS944]|uniref:helix-turn-helix domain-containing protein n=1 Tax=Niastella sp. OAS944 TaxID=2664089 RepID=UPI003490F2DB|nr:transcriptional regulator with XRE-family HTH domain [Chitinophagaceae bacterium OAS944]
MNLGKAIKNVRKRKKLSQEELARGAGITQAALSQIENGKRPGTKTLNKICTALEISESLIYVIGIEEEDVPKKNKVLYKKLFPVIQDLVLQIAME